MPISPSSPRGNSSVREGKQAPQSEQGNDSSKLFSASPSRALSQQEKTSSLSDLPPAPAHSGGPPPAPVHSGRLPPGVEPETLLSPLPPPLNSSAPPNPLPCPPLTIETLAQHNAGLSSERPQSVAEWIDSVPIVPEESKKTPNHASSKAPGRGK